MPLPDCSRCPITLRIAQQILSLLPLARLLEIIVFFDLVVAGKVKDVKIQNDPAEIQKAMEEEQKKVNVAYAI